MRLILLCLLVCFASSWTYGQADSTLDVQRYERGFAFRAGLYRTFQDFRMNRPIPAERIRGEKLPQSDPNFWQKITARNTVSFEDDTGSIQQVRTSELWGYSNGKNVYVTPNVRMSIIGAICHLTVFISPGSGAYMDTRGNMAMSQGSQESNVQYILDFETGSLVPFHKKNLESIFQRDAELFAEYQKAKGRKRDKLYIYLNRYNQRHPVYFPR